MSVAQRGGVKNSSHISSPAEPIIKYNYLDLIDNFLSHVTLVQSEMHPAASFLLVAGRRINEEKWNGVHYAHAVRVKAMVRVVLSQVCGSCTSLKALVLTQDGLVLHENGFNVRVAWESWVQTIISSVSQSLYTASLPTNEMSDPFFSV